MSKLPASCLCRLPEGAESDPRLRRGCRWSVLVTVGRHANNQGLAFPSVRRIAAVVGVGERAVQRALRDLEAWGYLFVARAGGSWKSGLGYERKPTEYQLNAAVTGHAWRGTDTGTPGVEPTPVLVSDQGIYPRREGDTGPASVSLSDPRGEDDTLTRSENPRKEPEEDEPGGAQAPVHRRRTAAHAVTELPPDVGAELDPYLEHHDFPSEVRAAVSRVLDSSPHFTPTLVATALREMKGKGKEFGEERLKRWCANKVRDAAGVPRTAPPAAHGTAMRQGVPRSGFGGPTSIGDILPTIAAVREASQ